MAQAIMQVAIEDAKARVHSMSEVAGPAEISGGPITERTTARKNGSTLKNQHSRGRSKISSMSY